jgi:hypothetical protein
VQKLSCRIGLSIGDSFAELRARPNSQADSGTESRDAVKSIGQSRWYFGRKSLTDGLIEALQKISTEHGEETLASGVLQIGTSRVERAVERRQGAYPAILITSGFENRLKLPVQKNLPIDSGLVFGTAARVSRDGQIISPFKVEDLEFLAAKFELLKVKTVALVFVNSSLNPELEATARNFFVEKGYRVVGSDDVGPALGEDFRGVASEDERWRQIIEAAYAESAVDELRKQIDEALEKALGERRADWKTEFWTRQGLVDWSKLSASRARDGVRSANAQTAPVLALAPSTCVLHLGLEMFQLLNPGTKRPSLLPFRASHRIAMGDWPFPTLTQEDVGYEPGPMLFGKSHQLTFLDLLFTQGQLKEIEGLTPLISEKSRARILESILTLARVIPRDDTSSPIDPRAVAHDLETSCIEKISGALLINGVRGKVSLTGAFAESFFPLLKHRRPDLTFSVAKDAQWAEADACGKFSS